MAREVLREARSAEGDAVLKTQLIMQILRQTRNRGDSAIVYDPACEYIQRICDERRGDIVLNPLDDTRFVRWARAGVWERVFTDLVADKENQYSMDGSTIVRAHQQAAAGRKKGSADKALGRSRGGLSTRFTC